MPPKKIALVEKPLVADELVTDAEYRRIVLSQMRASPDNRKRFSELGLTELAASIKAMGVVQPILIRPVTPTAEQPEIYEIVAGERRYRASIIAGLLDIPTMIRTLSDLDAAKIRILENLQREDPHPIEEAEGYQLLMLQHGYNADQLADEIKKSRAYVYARLKLCALTNEVRDMVFNDVIPTSTALLIARIPVPALQIKALHEVIRPNGASIEQMSVRRAAEHIQQNYMLDLTTAIFKTTDAKLVPTAGPCTTCPKRAGNDPLVFEGIRADVCTDPVCFAEKKAAHHTAIFERAEKNGVPVVADAEGRRQLFAQRWASFAEFVRPDANIFQFNRNAPATKNSGTPMSILGATGLPPVALYTKDDDGTTLAWYKHSAMQAALEAAGACETAEQHAERLKSKVNPLDGAHEDKTAAMLAQCPHEKKAKEETQFRVALYKKLREKGASTGFSLDSLRAFTKRAVWLLDLPVHLLGDIYDFDTTNAASICEYVDRAGLPEIQLLLIDMIVDDSLSIGRQAVQNGSCVRDDFGTVLRMAAHEGIDADALREEMFPTPINVDDATEDSLVALFAKYPKRLSELNDIVLSHRRGELTPMLLRAGEKAGYCYTVNGWEKLPPLLVGAGPNAKLKEIPATSVIIDESHRSGDEPPTDDFLQEMMVEEPKPAKGKSKAKPAAMPAKLKPAAAWPFPRSSKEGLVPKAAAPGDVTTDAEQVAA
jgi:ParB/RepB/Spo0J family partition protein